MPAPPSPTTRTHAHTRRCSRFASLAESALRREYRLGPPSPRNPLSTFFLREAASHGLGCCRHNSPDLRQTPNWFRPPGSPPTISFQDQRPVHSLRPQEPRQTKTRAAHPRSQPCQPPATSCRSWQPHVPRPVAPVPDCCHYQCISPPRGGHLLLRAPQDGLSPPLCFQPTPRIPEAATTPATTPHLQPPWDLLREHSPLQPPRQPASAQETPFEGKVSHPALSPLSLHTYYHVTHKLIHLEINIC